MLHRVSANNPAVFVYGEHAAMDGNTKCKASPLHQASVDNLHARQEVDLVRKEDVENTSARKSRKGFGNNVQSAAVWSTAETMKGHYVDYCPPVPRHFEPAPLETRMSPQYNDLSPTQHARQKIDPWHTPTSQRKCAIRNKMTRTSKKDGASKKEAQHKKNGTSKTDEFVSIILNLSVL
eukprot:GEMP01090522.1.p1 GENE.GEMP01090522.1~~GEMP01090522.1.p1  ORF type:complete len:179 (+),score=25.13 GEMP01090522.1:122-658(+)